MIDRSQTAGMAEKGELDAEVSAYERVREAILFGKLAPGAVYTQADLTELLGVGRTPLREAVHRLQGEGLFLDEPNRRLRVSPLTTDDLSSLYAMRIALEPLAVRLTIRRLSDDDLSELRNALEAIEIGANQGNYEATRAPHRLFHHLLFSRAGERFVREVQELRDHADRYRRLVFAGSDDSFAMLGTSATDHAAIADSAFAREPDRCADLIAQHLTRSALFIFAELEGSFEPSDVRAALQFARFGAATEPKPSESGSRA